MTDEEMAIHIQYIRESLAEIKGMLAKQNSKIDVLDQHVNEQDSEIAVIKVRSGFIAGIVSLIGGAIAVLISIFLRRS